MLHGLIQSVKRLGALYITVSRIENDFLAINPPHLRRTSRARDTVHRQRSLCECRTFDDFATTRLVNRKSIDRRL